jgi:hypothetical protein
MCHSKVEHQIETNFDIKRQIIIIIIIIIIIMKSLILKDKTKENDKERVK